MPEPFKYSREQKGYQLINEVYFWTSVIKDWKYLLKDDKMKMITIENFQWLVKYELVYIYGYVIMPNHVHLLWEQLKMNGKETPPIALMLINKHLNVDKN